MQDNGFYTVRFRFAKVRSAKYISHLDLSRLLARAIRRTDLPVWYTQGFNPHVYMGFSLPLPLGGRAFVNRSICVLLRKSTKIRLCRP